MLVSVGDLATDLVVRLGADEIDPVSDTPAAVSVHRGGSAANVAAVSARLGRPARFVGALGSDDLAAAAATSLAALGVDVCGPPARRGWAVVALVDPDGHRRFLTDSGDVDPWPAPEPSWLDGATRVHFTGYALCSERSTDACIALAAMARQREIPRSVDPSSVSVLSAFGLDRFRELMGEIRPDLVFPNADEGRLFDDDWGAPATQAVTDGPGPTRVIDPDRRERTFAVVPTPAVDTTGAGDAFVAGFLASWDTRAASPAAAGEAVRAGHAAAARVVSGPGADAWSADVTDLDKDG